MRALPNRVHVRRHTSRAGHEVQCDGCNRTSWLSWLTWPTVFAVAVGHAKLCVELWQANCRDARLCWACEGKRLPMGPCLVCDGKGWLPREEREVAR